MLVRQNPYFVYAVRAGVEATEKFIKGVGLPITFFSSLKTVVVIYRRTERPELRLIEETTREIWGDIINHPAHDHEGGACST